MLFIDNDTVKQLLSMEMTIQESEAGYLGLSRGETVATPRWSALLPTTDPGKTFSFGWINGGSSISGYFVARMLLDITYQREHHGMRVTEKYNTKPGLYCGLFLLIDVNTAEPLALINDGYLQHMSVGADGGIGAKYMAREDASVVGVLGSGGMARSRLDAIRLVRPISRVKVYSPTKEHRESYAVEMSERLKVEVLPVDNPREVHRGVDILAECSDAAEPTVIGDWLEPGTHVVAVTTGDGALDLQAQRRIDVYLKLGWPTTPEGYPPYEEGNLVIAAKSLRGASAKQKRAEPGVLPEPIVLADLLAGTKQGRTSAEQITYSMAGNAQGARYFGACGRVYELARARGLGREVPTEWFMQDIRD